MADKKYDEIILGYIRAALEPDEELQVMDVIKNNGVSLKGVIIRNHESNVAPTVYIDRYINDVECGVITSEKAAELILADYRGKEIEMKSTIQTNVCIEKDYVIGNLTFSVVNAAKNTEFLKTHPYRRYLDFALTYRVMVNTFGSHSTASYSISSSQAELIGLDEEDLYNAAMKNLSKEEFRVKSLLQMLKDMAEQGIGEAPDYTPEDEVFPMFVVSNLKGLNGARAILRKDIFDGVSERFDGNLFIIPSSIHELIIVVDNGYMKADELSELVKSVNGSEVDEQEVLSDNVYYYDRESKEISIA